MTGKTFDLKGWQVWDASCVRCRNVVRVPTWEGEPFPAFPRVCPFCSYGSPFDALLTEVRRKGL